MELLTDRAVELKVGGEPDCVTLVCWCWWGRGQLKRGRGMPRACSSCPSSPCPQPPAAHAAACRQVIERVRLKAATFGQDLGSSSDGSGGGGSSSYKVRPEVVAALYEQWVMPLTKQVEVRSSCGWAWWGCCWEPQG